MVFAQRLGLDGLKLVSWLGLFPPNLTLWFCEISFLLLEYFIEKNSNDLYWNIFFIPVLKTSIIL